MLLKYIDIEFEFELLPAFNRSVIACKVNLILPYTFQLQSSREITCSTKRVILLDVYITHVSLPVRVSLCSVYDTYGLYVCCSNCITVRLTRTGKYGVLFNSAKSTYIKSCSY